MTAISRSALQELARVAGGIPIWGCLPGSTAAQVGLRYGDILLEVNGMLTPTIDEYLVARDLREDGLDIVFLRDGEKLSRFVPFRVVTEDLREVAAQVVEARLMAPSEPAPKGPAS
jgi:hypothetical protein